MVTSGTEGEEEGEKSSLGLHLGKAGKKKTKKKRQSNT